MTDLIRRDPFQDVLSLRDAMNQLFEESFVFPTIAGRTAQGFAPAIDLSETADAYLVDATVPGLKAEDLQVTFENNVLTIGGEIRQEQASKERNYHRVERRFGSFQRSMTLPHAIKPDAINATLTDGVLHLEIPKAEEVKPRRINVTVGKTRS